MVPMLQVPPERDVSKSFPADLLSRDELSQRGAGSMPLSSSSAVDMKSSDGSILPVAVALKSITHAPVCAMHKVNFVPTCLVCNTRHTHLSACRCVDKLSMANGQWV